VEPVVNLRWEVVLIYKCSPKISGPSPKPGVLKNVKFFTIFSQLPHSTPRISGTKRRIDK